MYLYYEDIIKQLVCTHNFFPKMTPFGKFAGLTVHTYPWTHPLHRYQL